MSSIDSVGSNLMQYMQQMRVAGSGVQGGNGPPPPKGDVPEPLWEDVESTAETAGMTEEEIEELRTDIKSAIVEAMENLDASSSTDGRAVIDEAILGTLEEHGLDTDAIREKMAQAPSGPPPQGAGQGPGQGPGQAYGVQSSQSGGISVVSHTVCILSRVARARRTFSRIVSALAVQTNERGFSL